MDREVGCARPAGEFLSGGYDPPKLRYRDKVQTLLSWMGHLHPADRSAIVDLSLDVVETIFSLIPAADVQRLSRIPLPEGDGYYTEWEGVAEWRADAHPESLVAGRFRRVFSGTIRAPLAPAQVVGRTRSPARRECMPISTC